MVLNRADELLPVGSELGHLGQNLHIIRRLGEGFTSVVYEGTLSDGENQIPVAVKAMKQIDILNADQRFREEAATLAMMMEFEEEANKNQRLSLKVVPIFYGMSSYRGVDYFVMEFIRGIELPELLARYARLPEDQALVIAWHLYRTLDILHTRLKKTFVDFKSENLWWVQGDDNHPSQLKITDLGTLAEIKSSQSVYGSIDRDLLLAGIIIFHTMTGYVVSYNIRGLKEDLAIQINKSNLSWGTKQFLRRVLHRNPQQRFPNAAAAAIELRQLVDYWNKTDDDLYDISNNNLNEALKQADPASQIVRDHARRARVALGIIKQRNPGFQKEGFASAIESSENILQRSDRFSLARELFLAGAYLEAQMGFNEAKEWANEPAISRRWAYLSQSMIGNQIPRDRFDQIRDDAIKVIDRLNDGMWDAARLRLNPILPLLNPNSADLLLADCDLFENLEKAKVAENKDLYSDAATLYRLAYQSMRRLPDADFIANQETGDLLDRADELDRLHNTRGAALKAMEASRVEYNAGRYKEGFEFLHRAVQLDPQNTSIPQFIIELSGKMLHANLYEDVGKILQVGMSLPNAQNQFCPLAQFTLNLQKASYAAQVRDSVGLKRYLEEAVGACESPQDKTTIALSTLLESIENDAVNKGWTDNLAILPGVVAKLPRDVNAWLQRLDSALSNVNSQITKDLQNVIDQKILLAISLAWISYPDQARKLASRRSMRQVHHDIANRRVSLEEATKLSEQAASIALPLNYRLGDIDTIKARIGDLLEHVKSPAHEITISQTDIEKLREDLKISWQKYEYFTAWANQGISIGADPHTTKRISDQTYEMLRQLFFQAHYFLVNVDDQDSFANHVFDEISRNLSLSGEHGWLELSKEANQKVELINKDLDRARILIEQGNFSESCAEVDRLGLIYPNSTEWIELKKRLLNITSFQAWVVENHDTLSGSNINPDFLFQIRKFIQIGVPKVYFGQNKINEFLQRALLAARERTNESMIDYEDEEFINSIQDWVNITQTIGVIQE